MFALLAFVQITTRFSALADASEVGTSGATAFVSLARWKMQIEKCVASTKEV